MNSDLETIKNRLNIVDVIGQYLKLEKAGTNWRSVCPFHNEKTPSFMVSEDKQIWHCFGCQKGGDIFSFVMEMEGLEFREVLYMLAEKAGVQLQKYEVNPAQRKERDRTLEIIELASKFYEHCLWKSLGGEKVLVYLKKRGLKDDIIKKFRLGYAPNSWKNILNFLTQKGYSEKEIEKSGLLVKSKKNTRENGFYDRFRARIIFPIAEAQGKIVGFSARVTPGQDESQAKYVNTPETEVYHKSRILFGLDKAKTSIKQNDWILLVEGNMDVVAANQAGIENVVAVSGTALTEEQVKIIKRYTQNIKMFFDMDQAGQIATKKSLKLCFREGLNPKIIDLPYGKDAADLVQEDPGLLLKSIQEAKPALENIIEKAIEQFDVKSAEGKKRIAQEIIEIMVNMESDLEKDHWIKFLAQKIDTTEKILTDMLKKANLKSSNHQDSAEKGIDDFNLQDKNSVIQNKIFGLALVYPVIWEKITKDEEIMTFFQNSSWLEVIKNGKNFDFEFDKFFNQLEEGEEKNRAERLFVEERYQMDLQGNLEEKILSNPLPEVERYLKEIRIENKRKELSQIVNDLQKAQQKKDKSAEKFLTEESKRLSQELANLI